MHFLHHQNTTRKRKKQGTGNSTQIIKKGFRYSNKLLQMTVLHDYNTTMHKNRVQRFSTTRTDRQANWPVVTFKVKAVLMKPHSLLKTPSNKQKFL